jgi:hypothetical protein
VRLSPRCPERPREGGLAAGVGAGGWIYAVENWTVGDNFGSSSTAVSRVSRLARTTNERHPRAPTSERVGLWVLPGCGEHTGTARALGGSWLGCNEDMERGGPGGRQRGGERRVDSWVERASDERGKRSQDDCSVDGKVKVKIKITLCAALAPAGRPLVPASQLINCLPAPTRNARIPLRGPRVLMEWR